MRNAWEGGGPDLDAPATITERELRSLKRKAGAGVWAMILILMATGAVGYAMVAPESARAFRDDVRERLGLTRGVDSGSSATEENLAPGGQTAALPESAAVPSAPSAPDSAKPATVAANPGAATTPTAGAKPAAK